MESIVLVALGGSGDWLRGRGWMVDQRGGEGVGELDAGRGGRSQSCVSRGAC